ncbi:hypothetical protein DMB66_23225 [Actinoplanes sp. ATCC 53533]|uniref:putative PEP-binding protein n=1 Tax=Actinoplanes sp. ATCC 53533 TaxID=1288362 RepID=UPI000F7A6E28|nr:putative PEP-binding protein [Actinoplanes sp. ATCC 53533]RSM61978.1 hypothetical protein DMB66_23225 [Actinoplanes sp. ATCC 53533]
MTQFPATGHAETSGWCSTHDPETGERRTNGRWLEGHAKDDIRSWLSARPIHDLLELDPRLWKRLDALATELEAGEKAPVQYEFEHDARGLRVVRVRAARLRPRAHVTAVHDLALRHVVSSDEAVLMVSPQQIEACALPTVTAAPDALLGAGLGVSAGVVRGRVVFGAQEAIEAGNRGDRCVLVVDDVRPEDVAVSDHLVGLVALRGGATSHAAVVAKGIGLPMLAGLRDATFDAAKGELTVGDRTVRRHELVTMDGASGHLYFGAVPIRQEQVPARAGLIAWADRHAMARVTANADSSKEVHNAIRLGAQGIGLCRIEHALAAAGAIPLIRTLTDEADPGRRAALLDQVTEILTHHLMEVLDAASGAPVTIRLLDIPRHELLDAVAAADSPGVTPAEINPMMGTRGVRDLLLHPDIGAAQVRAIVRAHRKTCTQPAATIRILVPMVAFPEEFRAARKLIDDVVADELAADSEVSVEIGCMIETPRAALCAGELAAQADFLSIGSNDLTQFTMGISRDDALAGFLSAYRERDLIGADPFVRLDEAGVGALLRICVEQARARRPDIPISICGEHAGDPRSASFLLALGVDHLSCTPGRVPLMRFTAGRATLRQSSLSAGSRSRRPC